MKILHNHLILYDAECPMCQLYTRAFTTSGMLDPTGRAPYQDPPSAVCPVVDLQRAVNEIALVDTKTGEVKYGIESRDPHSATPDRRLHLLAAARCHCLVPHRRRPHAARTHPPYQDTRPRLDPDHYLGPLPTPRTPNPYHTT